MKKILSAVILFSLLFLIICKANSKVIVLAEKDDSTQYIEKQSENTENKDEILAINTVTKEPFYIEQIPLSRELQEYTYNICKDRNIDYNLILAVMKRESNYNISAIGYNANGTYDSGLMQINSGNINSIEDTYGFSDIMNPYNNILVGIDMLTTKINEFGEEGGLMAYNLGNGGYQNAVQVGITSNEYSNIILEYKDEIQKMDREV